MKKCPCCGFEPTPTNRQLLTVYEREFGAFPVMNMIDRQWLGSVEKSDIPAIRKSLIRFFELSSEGELQELIEEKRNTQ